MIFTQPKTNNDVFITMKDQNRDLQAKLDAALKAIDELKSKSQPPAKGPPETPPNRVIPNPSPPASKASSPTSSSRGVPQKSNTEDRTHAFIRWRNFVPCVVAKIFIDCCVCFPFPIRFAPRLRRVMAEGSEGCPTPPSMWEEAFRQMQGHRADP